MHPRLIPLLLTPLILCAVVLYSSCYVVSQTEMALVTEFGKPVAKILDPGLHFKVPFTQTVEYFDKRLLEYEMPDEIEINAADEKRIKLKAFLRWRITDPLAFFQATHTAGIGGNRVQTMDLQLASLLGSSLRQVIGSVTFSALLSPERDSIMRDIRTLVAKQAASDTTSGGDHGRNASLTVDGYGIDIVDVRIVKADLPPENSAAIFRRMQTERKREANAYRAKGEEIAQGIRAKADRDRTVLLAEAQKQSEILRGEGDAEAAKISADAFGKDAEFYEFYRAMQAYQHSFSSKDTTFVLSPQSRFLKEFTLPDKH